MLYWEPLQTTWSHRPSMSQSRYWEERSPALWFMTCTGFEVQATTRSRHARCRSANNDGESLKTNHFDERPSGGSSRRASSAKRAKSAIFHATSR